VPDEIRDNWATIVPDKGGVDWNGEHTQHYLVLGKVTPDHVFIKEEIKFTDITFLKTYMNQISLELEFDDPFSNQYADTAMEDGIKASYFGWDMEAKMERVRQINSRITIIDKAKCPTVFKNFKNAGFNESVRLAVLKKEPDQHGLDGALHMIHPDPGPVDFRRRPKRLYEMPLMGELRV